MKTIELKHLYNRAGFGILPKQIHILEKKSKKEVIKTLFKDSQNSSELTIDTSEFLNVDLKNLKSNKVFAQELRQKSRKKIPTYNIAWIERLFNPKEELRERMTLFWANHFACVDRNILHVQSYNNTLRKNALGDFRVFVKAISKEASMIKYLNLKQNRKGNPNENFARELMELFTIGTGHYNEDDIKASARAFTGYNFNYYGEFNIRQKIHDDGIKTFMTKTGNFIGDDIIDIILEQKQCARFICEKIYRYFVNYSINQEHVEEMTAVFFKDYDIKKLMQHVFSSNWFYNENNIGTKIKSPIDWLISINNTIPLNFKNKKAIFYIQKQLGQQLLFPPNVSGWEGHQSWIDTNTIILRLKLPTLFLNKPIVPTVTNQNFLKKGKLYFKSNPDWAAFNANFENISNDNLDSYILNQEPTESLKKFLSSQKHLQKEDYVIQLMSLPEFQLC